MFVTLASLLQIWTESMKSKSGLWLVVCPLLAMCGFGCGRSDLPELAPVSGTITLDGKPCPKAIVLYSIQKENGGRPSSGLTDAEGHYELQYLDGVKGAHIGMNKVEVTTFWPDGEPGEGESESIPAKYNSKSTLTADVKDGRNTFDFNLESEVPKK